MTARSTHCSRLGKYSTIFCAAAPLVRAYCGVHAGQKLCDERSSLPAVSKYAHVGQRDVVRHAKDYSLANFLSLYMRCRCCSS